VAECRFRHRLQWRGRAGFSPDFRWFVGRVLLNFSGQPKPTVRFATLEGREIPVKDTLPDELVVGFLVTGQQHLVRITGDPGITDLDEGIRSSPAIPVWASFNGMPSR